MIFFQRHKAKQTEKIDPPAVDPPPLPKEEKPKPADTLQPIHVDDAQYLSLTRALRPGAARVLRDLTVDAPGTKAPAVLGGTGPSQPADPPSASPAEHPSDTPIV